MATLGKKLVTHEQQWNSNMTELNHLGAALLSKPAKLMGAMDKLFSAQNYYSDNPLTSMLIGNKKTDITLGTNSWEWEMTGADTRPATIMENIEPVSNTTPGRGRRTFKIKLSESWYVPGDILHPGAGSKYQFRVVDEVQKSGDGWVYILRMVTDEFDDSCPVKYLRPGTKWSKFYSQYEEANEQRGSTLTSTPIGFTNRMSKYGKKYKITDYASTEVLSVAIPDKNGVYQTSWVRYAEVSYWMQWYRELERGYWYSRSASTVIGGNGRPVITGAGLQEQLEDGHIHYYSHLTAKLIEEYLMDIFYGRVKPGKGRRIKGYTGEYGMFQFHKAIQNWANSSGFIKNIEVFTNKVGGGVHQNSLEAGYQFVRYNMANGSSLELVHNPLYDDRDTHFEIDPISGYPVESQRITFLDFAGDNSKESNIKLVKRKDSEAFTYVEGLYGPYGPKKGGSSAHSGSYYSMHVEKTCGLQVKDPTKCGELIFQRS